MPGASRFRVDAEVYGMPLFPRPAGGYAEFVAAPARQLARKPRTLDHLHAAALPLAGLTARQSLVDIAGVRPGDRVLIHAAGGGVGHLAVQIAKDRGAYVNGTASRGKHELVTRLGADEVIDYREVDFAEAVHEVDIVLELVGGDYGTRSIGVLRPGGLLVTAVERTNADLAARTEAGRLAVHLEHVLPLENVAKAHVLLETGLAGKAVLEI